MKILILNGSPQGRSGNCADIIQRIQQISKARPLQKTVGPKTVPGSRRLENSLKEEPDKPRVSAIGWDVVHLANITYGARLIQKIEKADALLFVTGTYWDSWGSPLQKFLEAATELEADPRIVGKPAGVVVLKHSVGGKGVLSRMQGVLSSFGFLLPPFTGMTLSLASQLAAENSGRSKNKHADDFWSLEDLGVVIGNLASAAQHPARWMVWPVDRKNFRKKWLK